MSKKSTAYVGGVLFAAVFGTIALVILSFFFFELW
jgi:hypothetical protein